MNYDRGESRITTVEVVVVVAFAVTGVPAEVRFVEPVFVAIVDANVCSLSVVVFRATQVVLLLGGS